MFSAAWAEGRDLSSPEVLADILNRAGFNADEAMAAIAQPAIKSELIEATDEAVARGVFGAPTFFVNDELFFGQDRMDWVKRALI